MSYNDFTQERAILIQEQEKSQELAKLSQDWMNLSLQHKYSYNFEWLGRPIIQYPQDIVAMQEIIWQVKPDLIIETGIAHGGSLIFSASMLVLNEACGGPKNSTVIGIDIDLRPHNRAALESHPLAHKLKIIEGSSVDEAVISQIKALATQYSSILVCLDSNHTHEHVLAELKAYAPLVTENSYCVVFDTCVERMQPDSCPNRPWGKANNPMTAVDEFLLSHPEFVIDQMIDAKLQISVAPRGYLRRKT